MFESIPTTTEIDKAPERKEAVVDYDSLVSEDAKRVLDSYCEQNPEDAERARYASESLVESLARYTKEFAGEKQRHYLYEAAYLSQFATTNESIRRYLGEYFNPKDGDELDWALRENVSCVLGDFRALTGLTENLRDKKRSNFQDALIGVGDDDSSEVWSHKFAVYDVEDIEEITSQVCREAFLIRSIQLSQTVRNYEEVGSQELVNAISDIESFFSPVSEAIGYDGVAISTKSKILQIRFEKNGDVELVNVTDEFYGETIGIDPEEQSERVEGALIEIFSGAGIDIDVESIDFAVDNHPELADVIIGTFVATIGGVRAECVFRVKGQGAFAEKVKEGKGIPMDELGVAVIVDNDNEAVARVLRSLVDNVSDSESRQGPLKFRNSPSREYSVQIRGNDKYVDQVSSVGGFTSVNTELKKNKDKDSSDFQVSKLTTEVMVGDGDRLPVRCEVQILTKEARRNSRLGIMAHVIYKLERHKKLTIEEKRNIASFLEAINDWGREERKHMQEDRIFSPKTVGRGRKFRAQSASVNGGAV